MREILCSTSDQVERDIFQKAKLTGIGYIHIYIFVSYIYRIFFGGINKQSQSTQNQFMATGDNAPIKASISMNSDVKQKHKGLHTFMATINCFGKGLMWQSSICMEGSFVTADATVCSWQLKTCSPAASTYICSAHSSLCS